jgi:guanine deaminase
MAGRRMSEATEMKSDAPHIIPTGALRGPALTFSGDPFESGVDATLRYESDVIVAFGEGVITHFGDARSIAAELPQSVPVTTCGPDALISAGFLDSHVHFPQTPMIASYGAQLLDWLQHLHVSHGREVRRP